MCNYAKQTTQVAAVEPQKLVIFVPQEHAFNGDEVEWSQLSLRAPNGQQPNVSGKDKDGNWVYGFTARRSAQRYIKSRTDYDVKKARTIAVEVTAITED